MSCGSRSLKLTVTCVVLSLVTPASSTLAPSGSVSIDCGGQQTFTCTVPGIAGWTINGLMGVAASGSTAGGVAGASARATTPDTGVTTTSTITITGFNTNDNGGTVQCVDIGSGAPTVEGVATISVATLASATAVMANVDQCSTTLTWSEPSDSSATTSVSCEPPSSQCSSCTSSGCSIGGLIPSTSYTFSVTRSRSGCGDMTAVSSAVMSGRIPRCGLAGVGYGNDSCPSFTFTPQGNVLPSTVVVSYQLVGDPSSAGSLNCAYPIDSRMCRLVVPGGTYNVRLTPQNSCGSPSVCPTFTEAIPGNCSRTLVNRLPAAATIASSTVSILSGVVPSVALILINIISVVVVFLVTRHCYKKSTKGGSSSRQEELYAQVEGKKVYEDINMTDSPAYGPTSSQNQ